MKRRPPGLTLPDPLFPYTALFRSAEDGGGAGFRRCLEQLQRDGFVVIAGAPTDEASARELFGRFGYIRETIFGGLWSLSAELKEHDDTAYTTQYLEPRSEEHTSELQSLMRNSYAVFCLKKKI